MKKTICILISLILTVSLFVGCQDNPDSNPVANFSSTPSHSSTPSSSSPDTSDPPSSSVPATSTPPASSVPDTSAPPASSTPVASAPPSTQPATQPSTQTTKPSSTGSSNQNDDNVVASGQWQSVPVYWKVTKDGVLTISGNRSMQEKAEYIWWDYKDIVTRIVVEDGITNIPNGTFKNMSNVTTVYLGNAITYIGKEAFLGCTALTSVTIPASITEIREEAFRDCTQLQAVTFASNGKLATIESKAFYNSGIRSLDFPDKLEHVEAYAFAECSNLESVRMDGILEWIEPRAFENCTALKDLYIGESIELTGNYIFAGCTDLTKIENYSNHFRSFKDLPKLTTLIIGGKMTTSGTYENCPSLTSVTFLSPIKEINSSAFSGCTSLTTIVIPDTVTVIGWHAFSKSGLTNITIPASVTEIGLAAFHDTALQEITFLGDSPKFANNNCFDNVPITAYYPADNPTWTEDVMSHYANITWVAQ